MSSSASSLELKVPGYVWKQMKSDSTVPESAVSQNARLGGDEAYIGRVRDGKNLFVGTAVPKKGICSYLTKDKTIKNSSDYEILTVEYLHDVMFLDMDTDNLTLDELLDRNNLLPAGSSENGEVLYVARHVDGENFYYGWCSKTAKSAFFPKDPKLGQQVLDKGIGLLTYHDVPQWGICPPGPIAQSST